MFHRLAQVSQNTNCKIMAGARDLSHLQKRDTGFTAPPVFQSMYTKGSFPEKKQARNEAEHLTISSTKVKNEWSYTSTPHMPLWHTQEQL